MRDDTAAGYRRAGTGRVAGAVLLAAAVLTVVAMAHHPTGVGSGGGGAPLTLGGFVHATMIVLMTANLWGLSVFTLRQGASGWMLAGIIGYGVSFVANLIAGMINGFIVPAVAAEVDRAASGGLFTLLWETNQAAARLGVYAISAAFALWSVHLLARRDATGVVAGVLGLIAALVPGIALFSGAISLDVGGAMLVYGIQAGWIGVIGLQMMRQAL